MKKCLWSSFFSWFYFIFFPSLSNLKGLKVFGFFLISLRIQAHLAVIPIGLNVSWRSWAAEILMRRTRFEGPFKRTRARGQRKQSSSPLRCVFINPPSSSPSSCSSWETKNKSPYARVFHTAVTSPRPRALRGYTRRVIKLSSALPKWVSVYLRPRDSARRRGAATHPCLVRIEESQQRDAFIARVPVLACGFKPLMGSFLLQVCRTQILNSRCTARPQSAARNYTCTALDHMHRCPTWLRSLERFLKPFRFYVAIRWLDKCLSHWSGPIGYFYS